MLATFIHTYRVDLFQGVGYICSEPNFSFAVCSAVCVSELSISVCCACLELCVWGRGLCMQGGLWVGVSNAMVAGAPDFFVVFKY